MGTASLAARISENLLRASPLTCLLLEPLGHAVQVSIRPAYSNLPPRRPAFWFRSSKAASSVLGEVFARGPRACRKRMAVIVGTSMSQAEVLIRQCAAHLGHSVMEDPLPQWGRVTTQIEEALDWLQLSGAMKALNREYKELRSSGKSVPSYQNWLASRLETMLADCADLAHLTRL